MSICRDELRRCVLDILAGGEASGPEVRGRLAGAGMHLSPLAFLGLMAELEALGVVCGRRSPADADGSAGDRRYRIGAGGSDLANAA